MTKAQELDEIIHQESRQREGRPSTFSEISRFSVDSNEDHDKDKAAGTDGLGEPLNTSTIREEAFSTPRSQAFPAPTAIATGRRRSSAISCSSGKATSQDLSTISNHYPTHIDLSVEPYPAGEGFPLRSSPFPDCNTDGPMPYSPISSSTRGIKSPPASATSTERTFGTDTTGARAEKWLHIPFVPKSLKITTTNDQISPRPSADSKAPEEREDGGSFLFESDADTSSLTDVTIGEARSASAAGKPRLVQRFSNRIVGLREILDNGPETPNSFARKKSVKRQGVIGLPETQEGDSDVVTPRGTGLLSPEEPCRDSSEFFPQSLVDGLRSNPITKAIMGGAPELQSNRASIVSDEGGGVDGQKAAPNFSDPRSPGKLEKKVTFPLPLHLVENHNREVEERRQSMVSTPYPLGYNGFKESNRRNKKQKKAAARDGPRDQLTLAIYTSKCKVPHVRRISIPTSTEKALYDRSMEKGPPTTARLVSDYDDEKFFRLIRSEYHSMRGLLRGRFGATTARTLRLVKYSTLQDLTLFPLFSSDNSIGIGRDALVEKTLLEHFLHPKTGRNKHRWTKWVSSLPGNTFRPDPAGFTTMPAPESSQPLEEGQAEDANAPTAPVSSTTPTSYALALEEGFSPIRISTAIALVILLAITATLLWIFLGLSSQSETYSTVRNVGPAPAAVGDVGNEAANSSSNNSIIITSGHIRATGFRDAGSRVQTGVVIGMGTLLFGLSGVGGWIGIGYLTR